MNCSGSFQDNQWFWIIQELRNPRILKPAQGNDCPKSLMR